MMALVVMAVLALYLLVALLVVRAAVRAARRRGIAGWKWGLPAALAMYLLVFWDHVPTLLAHRYYCQRHAGLTVHKTPEQWRAENPEVQFGSSKNFAGRFELRTTKKKIPLLPVFVFEDAIVDVNDDRKLVVVKSVASGYGSLGTVGTNSGWSVLKFWVGCATCYPRDGRFRDFREAFMQIGE